MRGEVFDRVVLGTFSEGLEGREPTKEGEALHYGEKCHSALHVWCTAC